MKNTEKIKSLEIREENFLRFVDKIPLKKNIINNLMAEIILSDEILYVYNNTL